MDPIAVSSLTPATARVVTHDDTVNFRIIIIQEKNLWGFRRGGRITNIFSRGNINYIWRWIRGIAGFLSGRGLSSMVIVVILKFGLTPSTVKGLLNHS